MKSRKQKVGGFTLIELLIVVVIIGIIASLTVVNFWSAREKAFRSTMLRDLRNLAHLEELYHSENFIYTVDLSDLGGQASREVTLTVNEATAEGWSATAVHSSLPGQSCGMYFGAAAPAGGAPAVSPGIPACDF